MYELFIAGTWLFIAGSWLFIAGSWLFIAGPDGKSILKNYTFCENPIPDGKSILKKSILCKNQFFGEKSMFLQLLLAAAAVAAAGRVRPEIWDGGTRTRAHITWGSARAQGRAGIYPPRLFLPRPR